ncbi:hypothetical protein IWX92DRAFT_356071 [Phyllosticta citricarpa]
MSCSRTSTNRADLWNGFLLFLSIASQLPGGVNQWFDVFRASRYDKGGGLETLSAASCELRNACMENARRQDPWSETAQTLQFQSFRCRFWQGFHVATSTWSAWLISSRAANGSINHSEDWNIGWKKKVPIFLFRSNQKGNDVCL